jgi:hypothetical protein
MQHRPVKQDAGAASPENFRVAAPRRLCQTNSLPHD